MNATGNTDITDDHSLTFELVNDKAELEHALETLRTDDPYDMDLGEWDCNSAHVSYKMESSVDTLLELVPRLMRSYEELLETTYTLADAWESYMNNQTPAGLYVP